MALVHWTQLPDSHEWACMRACVLTPPCHPLIHTHTCRGDMALVHWTQLPDSYDEWVLARVAPAPREPPADEKTRVWRVRKTMRSNVTCTKRVLY